MAEFRHRDLQSSDVSELRRQLNAELQAIERAIRELGSRGKVSAVQQADYFASFGEVVRVAPPAAGLRVALPPATLARASDRVVIVVEGQEGALSVEGIGTTVNGEETLTYDPGIGSVEFVLTEEGWFGWSAAMVAALPLTGLPDLAGLSLLGRAANSAGVMAAITGTAAHQFAKVNAAGNAVGFEALALAAFPTIAAKSILVNAGNVVAIPAALAGTAAFQYPRINAANNAIEWSTLSGHASASIVYAGDEFRRAALTGEVTAPVNDNDTTITRSTNFVWSGEHVHAQRSAGPTVAANQGAFWVEDTNPTLPVFTDELGAQWRMGYACVSVNTTSPTATNATTNLSMGGSYSVPANTARVGTVYRLTGEYVFVHTAAVTPTLTFEVLVNGVVEQSVVLTPVNVASTYSGWFVATIRFESVGAGGTAMITWKQVNIFESGVDQILSSLHTATDAVNTTVVRTIEARVRMTTAVASNTLTVTQGYIERLA